MKLLCVILIVCSLSMPLHASTILLSWHDPNKPKCNSYRIYRDGVLIATTNDTTLIDAAVTVGVRHTYYQIGVRGTEVSKPSKTASGLILDWTQGATDIMESCQWSTDSLTLLLVALPYSRWTINWAYAPGIFERVVGHCDYDFDFNNGKLNLSDFVYFGWYWARLPVAQRENALRGFGNCYQMQERMEYAR